MGEPVIMERESAIIIESARNNAPPSHPNESQLDIITALNVIRYTLDRFRYSAGSLFKSIWNTKNVR
jgi:hypothetical protein